MIVHDFNIQSVSVVPNKTNPVFLIDTNAVLPDAPNNLLLKIKNPCYFDNLTNTFIELIYGIGHICCRNC